MRLTKEQVDKVSGLILTRLKDNGLVVFKSDEHSVIEKIRDSILADLRAEDDLDREVEGILKNHAGAIDEQKADYRRMFTMVKTKLARERGITL